MSSARGRAQADAQDRGDGAGSEESARPLCRRNRPQRGFLLAAFFGEAPELRSWALKRDCSPGRFCPALLRVFQDYSSRRVRSICAAFQTGIEGFLKRLFMEARRASEGGGGLCERPGLLGASGA